MGASQRQSPRCCADPWRSFEFSFIIPSSSPPFERYRHGRVRYVVTATALGAGRGRSAVSIWREVFVIVQATPDGGPVPLDIQYHDVHEALGPLSVSLTSASLTVGGTATLSILHPDPPPGLSVHVIRVFLEQTVELYSDLRKGWLKLPVEKLRLWEKGYMPYKAKQPEPHIVPEDAFWLAQGENSPGRPGRAAHAYQGAAASHSSFSPFSPSSPLGRSTAGVPAHAYRVRTTVRMPDDNAMRPSTVRGSRSDIRISHDLGVEVYFSRLSVIDEREASESRGKPKVQVFSMRRSTVIPSCCCTFDTIHLPPYSFESPSNSRPSSPTPPTARNPTQADVDHWRLAQTLRAALPHASGPVTHAPPNRSAPGSRPASRDPSPTRPHLPHSGSSFSAFLHGRRSRNSSPERGTGSPGPSHEASSSAPSRRGRSGLSFTPAHTAGHATTSVMTAPASGTNTPRSLPSSYPWANSHLPPRTPGGHQTCNCGRTTEELTEAEQRLLGGAPTAPGAWIDAHEEGSEPPPWTPSRPASPSEGLHAEPYGERPSYLREKAPCPA
jgi:hypothetical protein